MKKIIRLLPVVFALMMIFAFGAFAAETEETPDGEQNITEVVLPAAPTGFSTYTTTNAFVNVSWEAVEGVDGYNVYVKRGDEWVFDQTTEKTQALVHDLLLNSKHVVGIKSFVEVDGVRYESEEICQGTVTTADFLPVTIYLFNKTKSVKDGINLVWEPEEAITGYRLYVAKGGKWVKIKDIYGMEKNEYLYTDEGLEYGKTYKFGIKTFVKGTEGLMFGDLRTHSVKHEDVRIVKNISSTVKADSITLKWDKVECAKGYRIFMYQGGKWKAIKTTTSTSYTVTGLEASKKYIFRVRAYEKVNGATVWFPYSKNYSAITGSKTVDAYRVKNLQKSFSDGDWHIKIKNVIDSDGDKLTLTLAGKGENLFMRYDYGKGLVIEYFYQASKDRLYVISDADKEYVIVPDDEAAYFVESMFAMAEVYKVQNVGKVTAKTCVYNGYSAVVETYTDTKYGIKKSYYFIKDKLSGVEFTYDGAREAYSSFTVTDTPSSSLFKVPSGYKKISWNDLV